LKPKLLELNEEQESEADEGSYQDLVVVNKLITRSKVQMKHFIKNSSGRRSKQRRSVDILPTTLKN